MSQLQSLQLSLENDVTTIRPEISGESIEFEVEDIEYLLEQLITSKKSDKLLVLFDLRDIDFVLTVGASRKLASHPSFEKVIGAQAFLLNTLNTRLSLSFFIRVHKPGYPSRNFDCPTEAGEWLKHYAGHSKLDQNI
jgi:hypothetical protein